MEFEEIKSCIVVILLGIGNKERIDFLKMDIEGVEDSVIRELFQTGKLNIIRECVVEYHHHIEPKEDSLSQTLRIFEDSHFGYQIYSHWEHLFQKENFKTYLSIHIKNRSTLYDSWKQDC